MTTHPAPPVTITPTTPEAILHILHTLPEFADPYPLDEINQRIGGVPHLILAAYIGGEQVGFKLGYERDGDFYSWLGGVLPGFRKMGIAKKLADAQEAWARENGYQTVFFKTRNRHKAMLSFSLNNGFDIYKVEEKDTIGEYRIWLRKSIIDKRNI